MPIMVAENSEVFFVVIVKITLYLGYRQKSCGKYAYIGNNHWDGQPFRMEVSAERVANEVASAPNPAIA